MYKGYTEINLTDKELARFYEGNDMEFCFSENEYILLKNMDKIVDKYCFQNDKLRKLKYKQIICNGNTISFEAVCYRLGPRWHQLCLRYR